jgi:carbon monoxide dehydrogenase subunit G
MLTIKTENKLIAASQSELFEFLSNISNLEKLMPEQVINWRSDGDLCTFTIKGMADIGLKISERVPNSDVNMQTHGKVPFPFVLNVHLIEIDDKQSEASIFFEGDMNSFLKMMAEKPLTNFCKLLLEGLAKYFLQKA